MFAARLVWLIWLECCPICQKVVGSIPSQGTYLGCRFNPQLGAYKRQPIDVFLTHWCFSLSPLLPLSKSNEKMSSGDNKKKCLLTFKNSKKGRDVSYSLLLNVLQWECIWIKLLFKLKHIFNTHFKNGLSSPLGRQVGLLWILTIWVLEGFFGQWYDHCSSLLS